MKISEYRSLEQPKKTLQSTRKKTGITKKDASESDIQLTVCQYLDLKMKQGKLMFWRSNNVGVYDAKNHIYRSIPKYSMLGVPDIIVIKDGWAIFLEIKSRKGKQSDGQKEFEALSKKNKAEYYIIRSLEDVIEIGL